MLILKREGISFAISTFPVKFLASQFTRFRTAASSGVCAAQLTFQ